MAGQRIALGLDPRSGDLASLTVDGREMLAERSPWYRAQLTDPGSRASRWADAKSAESIRVEEVKGGARITYTDSANRLKVIVNLETAAGEIAARLTVRSPADRILEAVQFPVLRLKARPGSESESVRLFMPGGDGYVVTHGGLRGNTWNGRAYPGHASMQFMALYDARGGLSLQCRDARAEPKDLQSVYEADPDLLEMRLTHKRPFETGRGFESPAVALLPCGSHWTSAATDYKAWARKQWWARPKKGEARPPAWLDSHLVILHGSLRPLGNGKHPVPLDRWPEVIRSLKQATGAEGVILDVREWEHKGIYTSPYYFPLYPSPEAVRNWLSAAEAEGARAMAMVSGLQWMIERKEFRTPSYVVTAFDGKALFEAQGRQVCVVNRDGEVQVDAPYFNWDGSKAKICPATLFARLHFRDTAAKLAEAGFRIFEFDQMNGGDCPPCYSPSHGHPIGPGIWIREQIARRIAEAREEGRGRLPEFATSLEDPCEVYLPHLDTYVGRAAHTTEWPANGEGSEVVPAFSFVYGPLARPLALDVPLTVYPDPYQLVLTARAAMSGAVPCTSLGWYSILSKYGPNDLLPSPEKLDPAQRQLLANLMRARSGSLREYIAQGEMLAAPPVDLKPASIAFRRWERDRNVDRRITHPEVLANGWEKPGGERAYLFVNIASEPRAFRYPVVVRGGARLAVNGGTPRNVPPGEGVEVSMPALSAAVLLIPKP